MLWNRAIGGVVFGLAFVVNPAFLVAGCGFDFGQKEAVALVERAGAHKTYRFVAAGSEYEATLDLTQATAPTAAIRSHAAFDVIASAHACDERTFVRSASACLDITKVPVEGSLKIVRLSAPGTILQRAVRGDVVIRGRRIQDPSVQLRTTTSGELIVLASADAQTFALAAISLLGSAEFGPIDFSRR